MSTARPLRIATRQSAQATAQATAVGEAIAAAYPGLEVELVAVETLGDQRADVPLHTMGGQGVFVKEVQRAVLDGHADLAVHSAKDLPTDRTAGLEIAAFCARRDAADALVGRALADLAPGATVATGSVRRRAQLQVLRPDLEFVELRGNIQTRLGKVPADGSIVMAVAALQILGLTDRVAERFDVDLFVPSPGQGCVAVECRADDPVTAARVATVDHRVTRAAVEIERAFLAELGTGCSLPVGAHVSNGRLTGFLADPDRSAHGAGAWWVRESIPLRGESAPDLAASQALARDLQRRLGVDGATAS
jgi:hydroxymethylbilane synthase